MNLSYAMHKMATLFTSNSAGKHLPIRRDMGQVQEVVMDLMRISDLLNRGYCHFIQSEPTMRERVNLSKVTSCSIFQADRSGFWDLLGSCTRTSEIKFILVSRIWIRCVWTMFFQHGAKTTMVVIDSSNVTVWEHNESNIFSWCMCN